MGEMADWLVEQALEKAMSYDHSYERISMNEIITDYLIENDTGQLVKDAREWLEDNPLAAENDRNMVMGILAHYRGYQKLTIKQKRSLAYRILFL